MADLAAVGIRAAMHRVPVEQNSAAYASRERHVKERPKSTAGAVDALAERPGIGVVVHDGGHLVARRQDAE